jgi:lysophospholipase L1-like esterase
LPILVKNERTERLICGRAFVRALAVAGLFSVASTAAQAQNVTGESDKSAPDRPAVIVPTDGLRSPVVPRGKTPKIGDSDGSTPRGEQRAVDAATALMSNFDSALTKVEGAPFGSGALAYAPAPMLEIPANQDVDAKTVPEAPPRATFLTASRDSNRSQHREAGGLTVLQIGDSHTAADVFTGELRRSLQARYGNGGPGYIDAGKPHPGIRTAALNVSASSGWTYSALQKSETGADFYLSGFTAKTAHSGEALTFSSQQPISYDLIEIEVSTGPRSGAINVTLDGVEPFQRSLATPNPDHVVYRFMPDGRATGELQRLSITTSEDLPVSISSVGIFNRRYGVSYSNIGFPGATIDLLNKFESNLFRDELKRLAPQIVVLGFGTNEGFNDNLDLDRYREHYLGVIRKIRESVPNVAIVMIGPPQAGRKSSGYKASGCSSAANCRERAEEADNCAWPSPPQLSRVREIQKEIAKQEDIAFWDWSTIMPAKCGAHAWHVAATPLVTADHVHFTSEGYKASARRFAEFLFPIIDHFKSTDYALSNH